MICKHEKKLSMLSVVADQRGYGKTLWEHSDDGRPCTPDQTKTFEHCDRLRAGIQAFRKLESLERVQ
jgi:hypothetical protein